MRYVLITLALSALVLLVTSSTAAVPQTMSYQGVLRDSGGDVVADGSYQMVFAIYDVAVGGTALWTEGQLLTVTDGLFDAILGSSTPLALPFDVPYWLGISVDGEPELTPRVELTSAPYARRAQYADEALSDGDWTISEPDIYRIGGNVGIGDSAPIYDLDIRHDVNHLTGIRIRNEHEAADSREGIYFANENGAQAGIVTYDNDSVYSSAMAIFNNRTGGHIRLNTAGMERVRIDNSGNVGIGEPSPGSLLDVGGTAEVDGFKMATGAAAGHVLTSNVSGVGTWQDLSGVFPLPYEGSAAVAETSAVFKIWNTSTGAAVWGQNTFEGTAGYLADGFAGVAGDHYPTRNFGTLGSLHYGLHAKARDAAADAIYGRHDPSMNWGKIGTATHAGYFDGDVTVTGGFLGIGADVPQDELDVVGECDITSDDYHEALDVVNTYSGQVGRVVNFDRTGTVNSANDILEISAPAGAPDDFQFIECDRGGTIEWAVQGNGTAAMKGAHISKGVQLCEMLPVYGGARSVRPGDVMVIDPASGRTLAQSSKARSTLVAGVYCGDPGVVGSTRGWMRAGASDEGTRSTIYTLDEMANEFDEVPLAVVGVVPCRVTAANGPINPGDLLVTSDTPGHAMRDASPAPGTVVGKALERLDAGTGVIDVLVTLQ